MRVAVTLLIGLAVIAALMVRCFTAARVARAPSGLGVRSGRLAACPETPNCVSTQSSDPAKRMDPIPYAGSRNVTRERLLAVIDAMPRTTVDTVTDDYIHVVFRSAIFRFPDDVEFLLDDEALVVHFRSTSRLGRYDLGVNRRRMEAIRRAVIGKG